MENRKPSRELQLAKITEASIGGKRGVEVEEMGI